MKLGTKKSICPEIKAKHLHFLLFENNTSTHGTSIDRTLVKKPPVLCCIWLLEKSDTTGKAGGLICPLKAVTVLPPKCGAAY
jgi:hypothetical protein